MEQAALGSQCGAGLRQFCQMGGRISMPLQIQGMCWK